MRVKTRLELAMYRKANMWVPSGEVMVEESGVPVQDDWSMAPDEERVRFSLSGVTRLCKTTRAVDSGKRGAHSNICVHFHRRCLVFKTALGLSNG